MTHQRRAESHEQISTRARGPGCLSAHFILQRHAKSDWTGNEADADRSLSGRGLRQGAQAVEDLVAFLTGEFDAYPGPGRDGAGRNVVDRELVVAGVDDRGLPGQSGAASSAIEGTRSPATVASTRSGLE